MSAEKGALLAQVLKTSGMAVTEKLAEDAGHEGGVHGGKEVRTMTLFAPEMTTKLGLFCGESAVALNCFL